VKLFWMFLETLLSFGQIVAFLAECFTRSRDFNLELNQNK
jgi:hypothetical protein